MASTLRLITPPSTLPLSLADVQGHLRLTGVPYDVDVVTALIEAATAYVERITGRQLITAEYEYAFDEWPRERWLELPRAPLATVDEITYLDTAGTLQVWPTSEYRVSAPQHDRGRVSLASNRVWPTLDLVFDAVSVAYTAGYGDTAASVPAPLRTAIALLVGHWYEHREAVVVGTIASDLPMAVSALVTPFRARVEQVVM